MNIFTDRLILRSFKLKDSSEFFRIIQDEDVKHYLKGVYVDSLAKVRGNIAIYKSADFKNDYYYAIEDRRSGYMLGAIIATRMNKYEIEVAYFIAKCYRECGYMKEALSTFLKQIGTWNKGMQFKFVVDKDNIPSINLLNALNITVDNESDTQYIYKFYGGTQHDN